MKLGEYTPRSAGGALIDRPRAAGPLSGRPSGMASAQQDSELQHSFGPGEVGFDFLPLDVPAAGAPPVPTSPRNVLPVLDLNGTGPLPELAAGNGAAKGAGRSNGQALAARSETATKAPGKIWLEGDAIFCACPDCRAPRTASSRAGIAQSSKRARARGRPSR